MHLAMRRLRRRALNVSVLPRTISAELAATSASCNMQVRMSLLPFCSAWVVDCDNPQGSRRGRCACSILILPDMLDEDIHCDGTNFSISRIHGRWQKNDLVAEIPSSFGAIAKTNCDEIDCGNGECDMRVIHHSIGLARWNEAALAIAMFWSRMAVPYAHQNTFHLDRDRTHEYVLTQSSQADAPNQKTSNLTIVLAWPRICLCSWLLLAGSRFMYSGHANADETRQRTSSLNVPRFADARLPCLPFN